MAEFADDAEDFKADLVKLGVRARSVESIANVIGYSPSHVSNLLNGGKLYSPGARTKIGEMIAAKANGPFTPTGARVEDLPDDIAFHSVPVATLYKTFAGPNSTTIVTKIVATFTSKFEAEEYVTWLNRQIERGGAR